VRVKPLWVAICMVLGVCVSAVRADVAPAHVAATQWHVAPTQSHVAPTHVAPTQSHGAATQWHVAPTQSHIAPTQSVGLLLQRFCYECHGDGNSAGDLELDVYKTRADFMRSKETWKKVIQYARTHTMPPPDAERQPTQDERDALVSAIQRQLYPFDPKNPDPGRVTIRRLNRAEYRNTVRDLIGVAFDPAIDFPQDDTGYGFDNIADVLTLPPMLMEKYLAAAEKVLDESIPTDRTESRERSVAATEARASFKRDDAQTADGWVALSSVNEDALSVAGESAAPAEYVVRVLAYAKYNAPPPPGKTGQEPLKLSILLGDAVVRDAEVTAGEGQPQWIETRVGVPVGRHLFRVAMRRERGLAADRTASGGRVGNEQTGVVLVKEILIDGPVSGAVRRIAGERLDITGALEVPADGKYVLRAQASAEYAGDEPAKMELSLDGKALRTFDVAAPAMLKAAPGGAKDLRDGARRAVPQIYEVQTELKAGKRQLVARFVNNLRDDASPDPNYRDRNIHIQHFEVVELSAPPRTPPLTEPMRRLFTKHAKPAAGSGEARALLAEFALRAWRRPPQSDELDRLVKLFDLAHENGEDFRGSVKHAMKAILVSPSFLFRGEPLLPVAMEPRGVHPIGEFELATRLSYFVWSTTPDGELLDLAARGELRKNLDAQVKRMLASPKSQGLVDNFAGQWLQFRNLDAAHPDAKKFEAYNDRLRDAMKRETQMFFDSILREDRSLLDVLTADYTFVNERLAKHYGLDGVQGEEFRRVSLANTPRRGVVTHGSVLTLTSNPTRTSPVKRGKWVLESLLGTAPPPPPANIPPLEKDGKPPTGTARQQLEKHRADPSCASCHASLDPIGFSLENFDAIGRFREKDGNEKIDASSAFLNGPKFTGAAELTAILAKTRRNDFLRSAAESALTYALGRGVEPFDQPAVEAILDELRKTDGRFSTLISGVVHSVPFQMRRSGPAAAEATGAAETVTAEVSHEVSHER
jgi:hypothetical protein